MNFYFKESEYEKVLSENDKINSLKVLITYSLLIRGRKKPLNIFFSSYLNSMNNRSEIKSRGKGKYLDEFVSLPTANPNIKMSINFELSVV